MSPSDPLPRPAGIVDEPVRALTPGDLVLVNRLVNLEQVLPNITHEINNALQVLGGLSELLASRPGLADDVVQKLGRMQAQTQRCNGLLRDLLGYARRDGTRPVADVSAAIEQALSLRRYHLSRARVTVEVDAGPAGLRAAMDVRHFEHVLVNLVLNAEQAMVGTADPHLTIRYGQAGDELVLTVGDSGPGVAPELRARCFEPFYTTREGALGLGLTVARALLSHARGTIDFIAAARVELRLPVA